MEERVREFGLRLAETAIERDWAGVHELLAPWLRARLSQEDVQAFFEDDYREMLANNDVEGEHYPGVAYVDGNSSTLADLRKPPSFKPTPRPIPQEVDAKNFRQWMNVQLQCTEDQAAELDFDYFTDLWLVVVELDEGLRVGYWSHDPY